MEPRVRKKSDGDVGDRVGGGGGGGRQHQYTRNLQRIFQHEHSFKFRQLENYDEAEEDRELLSPASVESEHGDLLGLDTGDPQFISTTDTREQCRPLVSRRGHAEEETEELIIIDNDVLEPGAVTTQPHGCHDPEVDMLKPVRRLTQKHIASSPYKGATRSMSMSPIAKDFCPNNWFEVDKEVNQEGFCKQLSWKCCFVCICLPVCYPCYLTRTVRKQRKKQNDRKCSDGGGLVSAGQVEVHSTLSSKNSTWRSKHSTINSRRVLKETNNNVDKEQSDKEIKDDSDVVNINVIFLQTSSSRKLINELREKKLLESCDYKSCIQGRSDSGNQKSNVISKLRLQQKGQTLKEEAEDSSPGTPDSPVVLRRFITDHVKTLPGSTSKKFHKKQINPSNTLPGGRCIQTSDVFYSLESNLDQRSLPKVPVPRTNNEVADTHMSSLPSMTSGRFFSANSSVFSGVSSPRSDLSPSKESDKVDDESSSTDQQSKHHIEPIVEIVDTVEDNTCATSRPKSVTEAAEKRFSLPTPEQNSGRLFDGERKQIVSSLDTRTSSSFLKKSFSLTSPYSSMTKVSVSTEDLPLEHKPSTRKSAAQEPGGHSAHSNKKYLTLPSNRLTLSSSFRSHKLGLQQLGVRRQEIVSCPPVQENFYDEGELSGWSTRDIYDIVSKDLPRMDVVILVVNQEEKKQIDKILSRATGVVGYIKEYWSGFFPLLMVEIPETNGDTDVIDNKSLMSLHSLFSVTHRIILDGEDSKSFLFESIGRFYSHIAVFQCEKFQQSLHTLRLGHLVSLSLTERFWFCSGLCQMRVSRRRGAEEGAEISPARSRFMKTVRNTIIQRASRVTGPGDSHSPASSTDNGDVA